MAEGLQSLGFQVDELLALSKQETMSIIGQYSGLILRSKFTVDAEFIESASQLTFIGRAGAGLDLIDVSLCKKKNIHVGSVLSSDVFYNEDPEEWKLWARHGVLAVEMETSALYTIAARKQCRALSILTVSDSLVTGEASGSLEREQNFTDMVEIALSALS